MSTQFMEKNITWVFASLISLAVLLLSLLSNSGVMAHFLTGHEFRPIQALLAGVMMLLLIVICAVLLFAPVEERWNRRQLVFLIIGSFAAWRLIVMFHLLNAAMGG